jgi:hypothetical protein
MVKMFLREISRLNQGLSNIWKTLVKLQTHTHIIAHAHKRQRQNADKWLRQCRFSYGTWQMKPSGRSHGASFHLYFSVSYNTRQFSPVPLFGSPGAQFVYSCTYTSFFIQTHVPSCVMSLAPNQKTRQESHNNWK